MLSKQKLEVSFKKNELSQTIAKYNFQYRPTLQKSQL